MLSSTARLSRVLRRNQLGFAPTSGGVVAALPYATMLVGQNSWAALADCMIARKMMRAIHVRKLFQALGAVPAAILIGLLGWTTATGVALTDTAAVTVIVVSHLFISIISAAGSRPAAVTIPLLYPSPPCDPPVADLHPPSPTLSPTFTHFLQPSRR